MEEHTSAKKSWFARHKVLTVILALIVIGIIAGGASGSKDKNKSTPAAPDKSASNISQSTPPAQTAATPAATPQVLLDLSGSGTKQTQKFTAASDWDLDWSFDCANFGGNQGNFIVSIYNGDGSMSYQNSLVNQLGASGSDVQHYHHGGTFYLDVNSECSWHVTAKG